MTRENLESYLVATTQAGKDGNLEKFIFFADLSLRKIDDIMKNMTTVKNDRAKAVRRDYIEAAQKILGEVYIIAENWVGEILKKETNPEQDPGEVPWETEDWRKELRGEDQ